jgi:lipoate-protein ligase A
MVFRPGFVLRSQVLGRKSKVTDLLGLLESDTPGFVFKSSLLCPFANLAIEDYIFRHSKPGSRILIFYRNNKSIIIGRNQNPWLEVNLKRLQELAPEPSQLVHLLRRRSGGGTVYHDRGNVNWSFICDSSEFTRDKYAKMIVQGLHKAGLKEADVNERHDMVVRGEKGSRKVSGSAYKISRQRALHHGTALLDSNLENISELLHSPARSFINARGTESVRSPVTNLGISQQVFEKSVEQEFREKYELNHEAHPTMAYGKECLDSAEVRRGYDELRVSCLAIDV